MRLVLDVMHCRGKLLTVDCGPRWIVIWKPQSLWKFSMRTMVQHCTWKLFKQCVYKGVMYYFRTAYRPGGNGIAERNHQMIKAIAERGETLPTEPVSWYNMLPKSGQKEKTVPQKVIFNCMFIHPRAVPVTRY